MAVNKVVYNTPNGEQVLMDLTGDSVTPETLAEGAVAHDASGERIVGTMPTDNVRYGKQTLTEAQKAQVRENIGAIDETKLAEELAKRGQLKPEFANSVEECTDTSKLYVLPDGYIYACKRTVGEIFTDVLVTVGYSPNTYLNTSGNVLPWELSTGSATTGYIPCKAGDVIRMENMLIPDQWRSNFYGNHVYSYNSSKTKIASVWMYDIGDNSTVADLNRVKDNGNIIQFTVAASKFGENVAYIIINAEDINSNSKIYVNSTFGETVEWVSTGHAFVPADYEDRIIALENFAEEIDETVSSIVKNVNTFDFTKYGLPILYLDGDVTGMSKDDKVTLKYNYQDRTGSCTVKWQGSSSLTYPKKNYTVTFDNAFEAAAGWGEHKKYCMKANFMEFSHSRNICCAKLWGKIVKSRNNVSSNLSALPNGGAIDGFPIVIVINGEYQGIYTFNIPKDAWMFGMGNGSQEAIICADLYGSASHATLFENEALCDGTDFEIEYTPDEDNTSWVANSINTLIRAVLASDGTDIDTTIAQYVDIDSAIDYMIFTPLVHGQDMLRKNYILATYDGVKWFFSAYDMDTTFGITWHGGYYGTKDGKAFNPAFGSASEEAPLLSSMATHKLFALLHQKKKDRIKARYNELRAGIMSEANVIHEFNEFAALIPKPYVDEEPKLWTTIPATSANNVSQISTHYMLRTKKIDAEVEALS